jgi:hypothetical protein
VHHKRQREDEGQDESRYSPRARWEECGHGTGNPVPVPSSYSAKKLVDKGKRKESLLEIGGKMSQGQRQGHEGNSRAGQHDFVAALGLSQKDPDDIPVREFRHVRRRSNSKKPAKFVQTQVKRQTARTSNLKSLL